MKKEKSEPVKTILTIVTGFLILFVLTRWRWAITVALVAGLIGLFSPWLSQKVNYLWMKLAYLLSLIVPNILLSIIFYLFLFPIAVISRLFRKKDPLILKNTLKSTYTVTNKSFSKESFEKPW